MSQSIVYPQVSEIIWLNLRLCQDKQLPFGLLNPQALEEAVMRPQLCIDGYEPFPDIWQKAAVLMDSLNKAKAFVSVNALSGFFAAALFLHLNDFVLAAHPDDAAQLQSVSLQQATIPQIADWLRQNAETAKNATV